MPDRKDTAVSGLDSLPLHAMLSCALVAFTIESDNELEVRLAAHGQRRGPPSLVAWLNVLQYLSDGPCSVEEICRRTYTKTEQIGHAVGCLERWGWVAVVLKPRGSPRSTSAEGWGSARRITSQSVLAASDNGRLLLDLQPAVISAVEVRWQERYGSALAAAEKAILRVAARLGVTMPEGLPSGWMKGDWRQLPFGELPEPRGGRFPVAVGRALLAMTAFYEQRSRIPLALSANTLRIIEQEGTALSDIPLRSGISPETIGPQYQMLSQLGLVAVADHPTRRGKLIRLTAAGADAQVAHTALVEEVETALEGDCRTAKSALRNVLAGRSNGDLALLEALRPPEGVRRSGAPLPALGRVTTNPASKVRNRELQKQAQTFVADPFAALPHYPVWDGNRGFGP